MGIILFVLKNASSTSALNERKREQQKFWNFFFFLVSLLLLSISISLVSESKFKGHYLWYIYLDFFKSKKVGFIVLVPFEHLQSELLSKFTLTEMGEKKPHTHKLLFRDCTMRDVASIKQITFFFMIVRKKKKSECNRTCFLFWFFFPENPTQPPFLVPVHPFKKERTYPQISFNKICFFIILLAFSIFDLVELFRNYTHSWKNCDWLKCGTFEGIWSSKTLKLKDSNIKKNTGSKILLSNNNLQKIKQKKNK